MISHLDDDLCLGLDDYDETITKRRDPCDDSQLWQWQDGNICINKLGKALDLVGGGRLGKFNRYI